MPATVKADIGKGRLDRAKKIVKKDACRSFFNASRPLYLETDASGAGLGARLLQIRNGMNCGKDKVSDNATLHPITFARKSLSSSEWH